MPPIRVSRHGLTKCPGCNHHVKLHTLGEPPQCPFCDRPLAARETTSGLLRLAVSGRSALIAASLFASSGLVACADDSSSSSPTDTAADTATDTAADTAADTVMDVEIIEDIGPVAEYGMPPDAGEQPAYGIPADVSEAPLYGMPADGF